MKHLRLPVAFIHLPLVVFAVVLGFVAEGLLRYLEWIDRRFIHCQSNLR